ncbi:hypothetical protein [Oricola indica]|uniref:hypothetical protein n=1 Tax=Oricola indica TaxID=2872591 RepID=UPI003CCBB34B
MHVVITLLGLLGAGLFWWYRLRAAGVAVRTIADAAGRAHGAAKRRRFRNRAAESPFAAIDDPVVGAATVVIAMAQDQGVFDDTAEHRLRETLLPVAGSPALVDEAVIYGKWAAGQCAEASTALRHVAPYLKQTLTPAERGQLLAIAETVIDPATGTSAHREQLLRTLVARLEV